MHYRNTIEQKGTVHTVKEETKSGIVTGKKEMKTGKGKKRKKRLRVLCGKFLFFGVMAFILFHFVFAVRVIHNNDMFPFLTDGELVVVYRFGKLGVNQAVLYEYDGQERFGRIVAQEGDRVQISESDFLINENTVYTANPYPTKVSDGKPVALTVPAGSYFLLNDYRERETDSRQFGCVSNIIGPIIFSMKYREF